MDEIRIALLTDGIYPWVMGGMQRHSYLLAKYLAVQGIHIDLYHPKIKEIPASGEIPGLDTEAQRRIQLIRVPTPKKGMLPGHYLKESFRFSESLLLEMKRRKPADLIIAKGFTAWAFFGKDRPKTPIAVNFHGLEMFQKSFSMYQWMQQVLLRGPSRYNMRQADRVFSYGGKISTLITDLGISRNKIVELPSGVEMSQIAGSPAPGSPNGMNFVFVGRWESRKGLKELLEAITLAGPSLNTSIFHIVGPVPEKFQRKAENIIYHGMIHEKGKLNELLRGCDVLLCPSHSEGMPNVILEAMSQGLAILATDTGAVNTMVDVRNGILIPDAKPELIRNAVLAFSGMSKADLNRRKEASLQRCREEFNWERIGKATADWITSLIRP